MLGFSCSIAVLVFAVFEVVASRKLYSFLKVPHVRNAAGLHMLLRVISALCVDTNRVYHLVLLLLHLHAAMTGFSVCFVPILLHDCDRGIGIMLLPAAFYPLRASGLLLPVYKHA